MARVVMTYDLDSGWDQFKKHAWKQGFYNILVTGGGNRVAPNTTIFMTDVAVSEAFRRFDLALAAASQELGKPIKASKVFGATIYEDWIIRSDQSS